MRILRHGESSHGVRVVLLPGVVVVKVSIAFPDMNECILTVCGYLCEVIFICVRLTHC